jgi:hypothetical protein
MRRLHPHPRMDIPISLAAYQQLLVASAGTGHQKEDWEIAAEAIDEWMRRHAPDTIAMPATKGYQWKALFLPEGTLLRTVFGGKNHHCMVEGDAIVFNGQAVSPSAFVNAVGGIRRNAWRCTWILFPDTKEWKLADTLRTRVRPSRQRKHMDVARPAAAGQSRLAGTPSPVPPAADPTPAQAAPFASSVPEEPCPQTPSNDQIKLPDSNSDNRSRHGRTDTSLSPPRCRRNTERRSGAAHWMPPTLREELHPLLYRICAFDGERRKTRARPHTSTGSS